MRRKPPSATILGIDINRLAVALDQPPELPALRRFEADPRADIEGHHAQVCLRMLEELDPFDDLVVQLVQLLETQMIDHDSVRDRSERSGLSANRVFHSRGVSSMTRLAG